MYEWIIIIIIIIRVNFRVDFKVGGKTKKNRPNGVRFLNLQVEKPLPSNLAQSEPKKHFRSNQDFLIIVINIV